MRESAPVQPTPNTTSTFTVNLPVESNRDERVFTDDIIGISAATGTGSLPIFAIPGQTNANAFTQPGTVDASATYPAMAHSPTTRVAGGARRGSPDSSFSSATRSSPGPARSVPAARGASGPPTSPLSAACPAPERGRARRHAQLPSDHLHWERRILTGSPAAKHVKKVRKLGSEKFSLNQGNGLKVPVKLNALGRKLAKHKKTPVTVVVDLGTVGETSKTMTMKGRGQG